jgi:hypothetical protein
MSSETFQPAKGFLFVLDDGIVISFCFMYSCDHKFKILIVLAFYKIIWKFSYRTPLLM